MAVLFVIIAAVHRLGIDSPDYTSSPLTLFVFFGAVILFISLIVLFLAVVLGASIGSKRIVKYGVINFLCVGVLLCLGFFIDAPTILYAT